MSTICTHDYDDVIFPCGHNVCVICYHDCRRCITCYNNYNIPQPNSPITKPINKFSEVKYNLSLQIEKQIMYIYVNYDINAGGTDYVQYYKNVLQNYSEIIAESKDLNLIINCCLRLGLLKQYIINNFEIEPQPSLPEQHATTYFKPNSKKMGGKRINLPDKESTTLQTETKFIDSYEKAIDLIEKDNKHIRYLFIKAMKENNDPFMFLGDLYYEGKEVKKDIVKAIHYYQMGKNYGYNGAILFSKSNFEYKLARIHFIMGNYSKAIELLKVAKKECCVYDLLGYIYYNGRGVEVDIIKASQYYMKGDGLQKCDKCKTEISEQINKINYRLDTNFS